MTIAHRILTIARPCALVLLGSAGLLVELTGYGLLCAGLWLVWPPLAAIVGGVILVLLAQGVRHNPTR